MTLAIEVDGDWSALGEATPIGRLLVDRVRGKESFAFSYHESWLASNHCRLLDPELQFYTGPQYPPDQERNNFGLFLDSSPDRWGRMLMQRREAHQARIDGRKPTRLMESDYLLGVHDEQRLGGLRLRTTDHGPYLSAQSELTAPPWTALRDLENAAWTLQSGTEVSAEKLSESLRLLVAPGSSIGGARPKAGVLDEQGQLWIAKFPGRNDDRDIGGWEQVTSELARLAGVTISDSMTESFGRPHHTFLTRRFDRQTTDHVRQRQHFASAMTMLGYCDGDDHRAGATYLEIAEWIIQNQNETDEDLVQLWRRIVFCVCVSNTDDHLRNHGFLLTEKGWRLSPAYDLNPDPQGTGLSLNISEIDNALSLDLAREVAPYFRVASDVANEIIDQVRDSVSRWRTVATQLGLKRSEQNQMQGAFRLAEK